MKRFEDKNGNVYDLKTLPAYIPYQLQSDTPSDQIPTAIKWGAHEFKTPPEIGGRVKILINSLGTGTVESYFVEGGWLGVCVKLDKVPEWKMKQEKNLSRREVALVFGREIVGVNHGKPPVGQTVYYASVRKLRKDSLPIVDVREAVTTGNGWRDYVGIQIAGKTGFRAGISADPKNIFPDLESAQARAVELAAAAIAQRQKEIDSLNESLKEACRKR